VLRPQKKNRIKKAQKRGKAPKGKGKRRKKNLAFIQYNIDNMMTTRTTVDNGHIVHGRFYFLGYVSLND